MTSIERLPLPSISYDERPLLRVVGGAPNPEDVAIRTAIPLDNQLVAIVLDLENFRNGKFILPGVPVEFLEVVNSHEENLRQLPFSTRYRGLLTGKYTGSGSLLGIPQYER